MIVRDLIDTLEAIAPTTNACDWDNVGLLVGAGDWPADRIMLTIDLTERVLDDAITGNVNAIVAYHPPIFTAIKRLTDHDVQQRIALRAAQHNISLYSPHTALDAAPGGVCDWLAESLGGGDIRALQHVETHPQGEQCKIIAFCPADAVEQIRNGLAAVGAGRIGAYELCSFETPGTGTFFGTDAANPAVGDKGSMQRVQEVRLEMVCPLRSLPLAVMSLREFHPYEEPAFDIIPLRAQPQRNVGIGRKVVLDQAVSLHDLCARIKTKLGLGHLRVARGRNAPEEHHVIGLCPGAGGALLDEAIAQGCELFFTGEMRHHDVLSAVARGCTIVLAGHTNTERGYLTVLRERLHAAHRDATITVAHCDTDPLEVM
jgi:dinuclear metal center YbgI/SA1388 family protein